MMGGLKAWLLSVLMVSLLCALAQTLMPKGAVRQVGRLVCGLALLCGVLWPLVRMKPFTDGEGWIEAWSGQLVERQAELEQQLDQGMKKIIEERCGAYIQDKAAQHKIRCTAQISCQLGEDGLFVPDRSELTGRFSNAEKELLAQMLEKDLGIPAERQIYYDDEGAEL